MKKKLIALLVAAMVVCSVTGCGMSKEALKAVTEQTKQTEEVEEAVEEAAEEVEETTEEAPEKKGDGPVLSADNSAEGYDGFEYLYEETLMTESEENAETGKMEKASLVVFIPKSDYASVNRDYASSDKLGVDVTVSLNPYFQYEQEDYLITENLQVMLDDEYDAYYSTDLKDLVISEVEAIGDNAARATASYIEWNEWDEVFEATYITYYAVELSKEVTVLVEAEMIPADVTGKTDALIEELEAFYQFDIEWDADAAAAKVAAFEADPSSNVNQASTGYLLFELPEGWAEDTFYAEYPTYTYAPDGDAEYSDHAVQIAREYVGGDEEAIAMLLENEEEAEAYFQEILGEDASNITFEDYGETVLGPTMKIGMTITEEGETANAVLYMAFSDGYMYMINAMSIAEVNEAEAVAESILANGQLKD